MKFVACTVCEQKFCTPSKLLTHVNLIHRNDLRFSIKCSLCQTINKSYSSYYRHFKKFYSHEINNDHGSIHEENATNENNTEDNQYTENGKSAFYIVSIYNNKSL